MKISQVAGILIVIILSVSAAGCNGSGSSSSDTSSSTSSETSDSSSSSDSSGSVVSSTIATAPYAASAAATSDTYNAEDIVGNVIFDYTIDIDFTAGTAQLSSGEVQDLPADAGGAITLLTDSGTTVATITKAASGMTLASTVAGKVRYNLAGELSGTLIVSSSSAYQLYLDGVDIAATAGPALNLNSTQKAYIVSASGTTNTLADSSSSSVKAAVFGKGPMVFSGDGTISVTGSYKHGIFSNDYIRVCGGTINVAVSVKNAVQSVNGFIFDDGNLTISATGTATDDESKGIKVDGAETTGTGKGYIVINGGYITITSVSKAITAGWDIDEDATTADTSDDPDPYVVINNGVISITTTGTPYEYYDSSGNKISCAPEGIEGKSSLTVNSGYITISTADDCMNAGDSIAINGGYIYCVSSKNDAIDSNGPLTITGGVVVASGSSAPEGAFDCDVNTFTVKGGTFVGIGGNVSRLYSASCKQNVVVLGSLTAGSTMAIKSGDGTVRFVYTIPKAYETMVLSSPDIASGTNTIYTGGTASATYIFGGLYLGSLSYSGGTAGASFTISSTVTKIGGTYF